MEEVENIGADEEIAIDPFEAAMLQRVKSDFQEAGQFLKTMHGNMVEAFEAYHNARSYEDLRKKNRFPMPIVQKLVDQFVAHILDKMFYANKPCTVVGVEEADKADAEAKQEMIAWQDRKDKITIKLEKFLRDVALYPYCVAQVDYVEKHTKKRQQVPVEVELEPTWFDRMRGLPPRTIEELQWQRVPVVQYRGPQVKRVAPEDFFFGPDKREINDDFPVMIRSKQTRAFFNDKDYFRNQDKIQDTPDGPQAEQEDTQKRGLLGVSPSSAESKRVHEYIEWQGPVDATRLFEYTGEEANPEPGEKVWAICGVVDGQVVVRLESSPLDLDGPNVVVGWATPEENEFFGGCMVDRAMAVHKGSQTIMGMLLENLKQSVNAMWIINQSALIQKSPLVNKAGHVLLTNSDVNNVAKRVEQPGVAKDLYTLTQMFEQMGQDTTNIQDIIAGRGEPAAETLGENTIIATQAELGLRRALRCFESTFVEPLYELRNEINCNFLDEEYVYYVIGDSVVNWRTITPEQVRARVDFLCESSTRETNKAVIGQQLLQLMEMSPTAHAMGQPVRQDLIMKKWLETMGSMKSAETLMFFPLIQMEKMQGIDANSMMVQQAMMQQQANIAGAMPPEPGGPGQSPQPKSEGEAAESANAQTQTHVGSM